MELAPVHYFPVPQLHLDPALVLLVLPALLILCDGIVCRTTRGMTHLIGKQEVVK